MVLSLVALTLPSNVRASTICPDVIRRQSTFIVLRSRCVLSTFEIEIHSGAIGVELRPSFIWRKSQLPSMSRYFITLTFGESQCFVHFSYTRSPRAFGKDIQFPQRPYQCWIEDETQMHCSCRLKNAVLLSSHLTASGNVLFQYVDHFSDKLNVCKPYNISLSGILPIMTWHLLYTYIQNKVGNRIVSCSWIFYISSVQIPFR